MNDYKADFLTIATREVQRGHLVFPCGERSKLPLTPNGCLNATLDMAVIESWAKRWPHANCGIAATKELKYCFLDIDKDNLATLDNWQRQYGIIETATKRTPGGGWHFEFIKPAGVELHNIAKDTGLGFELKVHNQYILAGGSVHPNGGVYDDFGY